MAWSDCLCSGIVLDVGELSEAWNKLYSLSNGVLVQSSGWFNKLINWESKCMPHRTNYSAKVPLKQ